MCPAHTGHMSNQTRDLCLPLRLTAFTEDGEIIPRRFL